MPGFIVPRYRSYWNRLQTAHCTKHPELKHNALLKTGHDRRENMAGGEKRGQGFNHIKSNQKPIKRLLRVESGADLESQFRSSLETS